MVTGYGCYNAKYRTHGASHCRRYLQGRKCRCAARRLSHNVAWCLSWQLLSGVHFEEDSINADDPLASAGDTAAWRTGIRQELRACSNESEGRAFVQGTESEICSAAYANTEIIPLDCRWWISRTGSEMSSTLYGFTYQQESGYQMWSHWSTDSR